MLICSFFVSIRRTSKVLFYRGLIAVDVIIVLWTLTDSQTARQTQGLAGEGLKARPGQAKSAALRANSFHMRGYGMVSLYVKLSVRVPPAPEKRKKRKPIEGCFLLICICIRLSVSCIRT